MFVIEVPDVFSEMFLNMCKKIVVIVVHVVLLHKSVCTGMVIDSFLFCM